MNTMTKLLCVILLCTSLSPDAQEYLNLKQDDVIYDVDVIVFARQLAQPDAEAIKNANAIKSEDVLQLETWDGETELLQYPPIEIKPENSDENWQVPIDAEEALPVNVLSWIVLTNSMTHPIINRLEANPTIKPLFRQKWRQPATAFTDPQYVEVSSLEETEEPTLTNTNRMENLIEEQPMIDDFSIDGQVAFSKQRFTHLHIKMNLYRQNINAEQIVYEISQQKRIELDEWQYFDHQQFGIIAKVTAINLKQNNE